MRSILPAFVLSFAAPALAQTYIVDIQGGPGTHFTSISAAVAAVPDGAVIVVRPGTYTAFTIGNKSLKVIADSGVRVYNPNSSGVAFDVANLQAGKSVVVAGFEVIPAFPTGVVHVRVNNCAGSVLIDRMRIGLGNAGTFHATNCNRLLLRATHASQMPHELTNCNTVAEGGTFTGGWVWTPMVVSGGTLQLAGCTLIGPMAVDLQGGDLRLLGTTNLTSFGTPMFAVGGSGTVRYDSSVVLAPASFAPGITAIATAMPTVTTTFAGANATASVTGGNGHLAAIAVALPGPLVSLPGLDAIWLDGATFTPLAVGVLGTSPLAVQMPWTSGPVPAVRAVFQALTYDPVAGFAISNPSLLILP